MGQSDKTSIELRVFAYLRDLLGLKEKKFSIPRGLGIKEFLEYIRDNLPNGDIFYNKIWDAEKGRVIDYLRIIINGHILMRNELDSFRFMDDEYVVAIFPPVAGGRR